MNKSQAKYKKKGLDIRILNFICILVLVICNLILAGGEKPTEFLELAIPAEYRATGNNYTGYSSGAESIWLNPAGLGIGYDAQYSISGMKGQENINLITGSILIPVINSCNIGLGLCYLGAAAEEYKNYIGVIDTSKKLNFNNIIFAIGSGFKFSNFYTGIGLKFINSQLAFDSDFLFLMDIGIETKLDFLKLYKTKTKNLGIGFSIKDIGLSNYKDSGFAELRAGIDYKIISSKIIELNLLSDFTSYAGKDIDIGIGTRVKLFKLVMLYSGYNLNTVNEFTFGLGVILKFKKYDLKLNYCLNPDISGLPLSHWIQLNLSSRVREFNLKTEQLYKKIDNLINAGNYDKSITELNELLKLFPDDKRALEKLASVENMKNKKELKSHFKNAELYFKLKDYENTKKELQKIIKKSPDNKEAYFLMAKVYYEQGNIKQALEYIKITLKLDNDYADAKKLEELIVEKATKEKPVWLKEDYFYKEQKLVFEDFEDETIIPKFITECGKFDRVVEDKLKYGKWELEKTTNKCILMTSIRLPDLSKFEGILVSLNSLNIPRIDIILIEQQLKTERKWTVPIPGITEDWKDIKIPFRYFQCPDDPTAKIDLVKVSQIQFLVSPEFTDLKQKNCFLGIDKFSFYK